MDGEKFAKRLYSSVIPEGTTPEYIHISLGPISLGPGPSDRLMVVFCDWAV